MVSFRDYFQEGSIPWTQSNLLGLQYLTGEEITVILDQAAEFKRLAAEGHSKLGLLKGTVVGNLFFEPSTRTRTSFGLAAKRLSADTVDFSPSGSSLSKGESFLDTARNIEAMGVSLMEVRHKTPGAQLFLSQRMNSPVLNAGDGTHEHPTQGLLDVMTMRERCGDLEGKTVALLGDIRHSRVARSNIWGLTKLGAKVIVCGPATLIPPQIEKLGVEVSYSLDDVIPRVDCINLLRIQFERQRGAFFPSIQEYAHLFGMNATRLKRARENVVILAPGPINRGVEITPYVADGKHSVILDQVSNGLAVRMAALYLLHRRQQELLSFPPEPQVSLI